MLHEMNQTPDVHTLNAKDDFNGQNTKDIDQVPDQSKIDQDYYVPDQSKIGKNFPVPPMWFPNVGPGPVYPCVNCLPFPTPAPTPTRTVSVRFLNASPLQANLTIQVDNWTVLTGMGSAEVSRYRQYSIDFHQVTVIASNGLTLLQQNVFFGNNSTIAIVSINNRMSLNIISDGGCGTSYNNSCFRVCNLAYASGAVNVTLPNAFMSFTNSQPGNAGSFNRLQAGTYFVNVARSARPAVNLLSTFITLNPNRVYTLYVMNWNPSPDTIRILLAEDMS